MKTTMIIPVLACLCILIAFSGCTGTLTGTAGQGSTPATAGTSSMAAVSAQNGGSLTVGPTVTLESYNMVTVDIGEKDYLGSIPVIFEGGMGQGHVKKIDVTLTLADGQVKTATIGNAKGDEADLMGTKDTDRIVVVVSMDNGESYKIIDKLVPYRTRQ